MKRYKLTYTYNRFQEWFVDNKIIQTKLFINDDIVIDLLKREIEKEEMVEIKILEIKTI